MMYGVSFVIFKLLAGNNTNIRHFGMSDKSIMYVS